jgi:hypothetical protein
MNSWYICPKRSHKKAEYRSGYREALEWLYSGMLWHLPRRFESCLRRISFCRKERPNATFLDLFECPNEAQALSSNLVCSWNEIERTTDLEHDLARHE